MDGYVDISVGCIAMDDSTRLAESEVTTSNTDNYTVYPALTVILTSYTDHLRASY